MSESSNKPTRIFLSFGLLFGGGAWAIFLGPDKGVSIWDVLANTLLLVSFAVLTVVILQFLWGAFGGDPIQTSVQALRESSALLEDSYTTGIRRVMTRSGSFGGDDDWLGFIKSANKSGSVDLMGYTLTSWINEGFEDCIRELLERGVQIRALFMDPENELFGLRFNENIVAQQPEDLRQDCNATRATFSRVRDSIPANNTLFQFRLVREGSIKMSYTRTDNRILAVPYLYSVSASSAPLLRIQGDSQINGLFAVYDREFTALWQKAGGIAGDSPTRGAIA